MATLHVERIGGLAGFGGTGSRIRSRGEVEASTLSTAEQQAVEALFHSHADAGPGQVRDGFRYKISRTTPAGTQTVEAPETAVPAVLAMCVKDELV